MDFTDRVVLLTGGAGPNMGLAFASAFAKAGATLVMVDLDGEAAQSAAAKLREQGGKVSAGQLDISDLGAAAATVEKVVRDHGRIDVLCSHAGWNGVMTAAHATDPAVWDMALLTNMTAPFILARTALPHMLAQGRGAITFTISEAGIRGAASGAAYTASKHGLVGLTKAIAWAYGKAGIRCNGVCPGGTTNADIGEPATANLPFVDPDDVFGWKRVEPVLRAAPRFIKPDEVAALAAFVSSEAASGLNGQIIAADGGWSAG